MTVIDGDAHINEPIEAFEQFLEEPYTSRRPRIVKDTLGFTRILLEGRLYPDPRLAQVHAQHVEGTSMGGTRPGAADPRARLDDMSLDGIDVQVIYGSLGLALASIADIDFAVAMNRACNDYYAHVCREDPTRLKCMAALPVQDVPSAVEELRRAVTELGHLGGTVPPNLGGKNLDHPDFHPIYAEASRLGVPISIHWGNGAYLTAAGADRFHTHFMTHAIGHPVEQMIAVASIITGGVLEAFPGLRLGFLEAGCGWVPYWVDRLHETYERRAGEVPRMKKDPLEYLADGNCYFGVEPDERLVPAVVEMLGDECLLYASDYPHTDSKFPHSVKYIRERADLSEGTKAKVLGGNAARFYALDAAGGRAGLTA